MAKLRQIQHLRTRLCEYKQIRKDEIPSGVTIESKSSIPTSADILELFKQNIQPAEYIQVTTNNWYYQLEGKAPSSEMVVYGELAICYQKGYERVFFKNSENELVSLQPITYIDSTVKGESTNIDVEVKQENGKLTNVVVTDRTEEAIEKGIHYAIQQLDSIAEGTSDKFDITIYQTDGVISDINIVDKMGNLAHDLNANVTSTNGTNVNVQVIQEEGKITAVNVTDNTQTAINNAISNLDLSDTINTAITESLQTLDETLVAESSNLKIELTQTDGLISELIITDNTNKKLVINNPELIEIENNECKWEIPYTQLTDAGIDPETAGVFVREIETGKQLISDITFNNENLIIKFSSMNTIPSDTYKVIIIG